MSLLLDALKRAESEKNRAKGSGATANSMPDFDLGTTDKLALDRNAAKNLFNVKRPGYDNYGKAKLIAGIGATALLISAAGFYAWYWYNTSFPAASHIAVNSKSLPSPASPASQPVKPAQPAVSQAPQPQPAQPVVVTQPSPAPETSMPKISTPGISTPGINTPSASVPAPAIKQEKPATPPKLKTAASTKSAPPKVVTAPRTLPIMPAPRAVTPSPVGVATPKITAASIGSSADAGIRLQRSPEEIYAINPNLGGAYQALIAGRLSEARQLYESVLQKEAGNADAELGLATIAAKNGDTGDAVRRYRRVLELDPKNTVAQAGLAALANDQPQTENQLRGQIALQPQSAPLAAALGSLFASQGRWNEAQQAYFDALRFDANNPDYTYNLAVSLDQLKQPKLALEHYQRALTLANVRANQFNKDAVARRIAELAAQN